MILVDSSVWIDYFTGRSAPQVDLLVWPVSLSGHEPPDPSNRERRFHGEATQRVVAG